MPRPTLNVIDQWSGLAHKDLLDSATAPRFTPSWVPVAERRRLAAYLVLARYLSNAARELLPSATTEEARKALREYGDPAALVDRVVAAVLGDDWSITVDGADDDLLDGPVLPDRPDDVADDADDLARRVHARRVAAWEAEATAAVEAWEAALDAQPRARLIQSELRAWADRVMLAATVNVAEHDAVGLGDGIYVLWPQPDAWPKCTQVPPDAYFPQLGDSGSPEEYPDEVRVAWGYETVDGTETRRWVRRMTWRLIPITAAHTVTGPDGGPSWDGGDRPLLADHEQVATDGTITRTMPWHDDDAEPSTVTCWHTDGTWDLAQVEAGKPDALDPARAAWWDQPGVDLGCDFVPVVHLPNTPAGSPHYGTALITRIAQVLDDVAQNDTDTMSAAGYLGDPTIALAGAQPGSTVMAPGQVYGVGEKGSMSVLDLSAGIEHLMTLGDRLVDRAGQNAGIPREVIGRAGVDSESGIHLALKLAPYAQMIAGLRLPRAPKYRLLLRQAVKLAMLAGAVEAGPVPEARLTFGPFLPTDRSATVELVAKALNAGAMSTATAVAMLVAAGVPVDDAAAEVARIHGQDGATARDIADATGSEILAASWLGLELPTADTGGAPVIDLGE